MKNIFNMISGRLNKILSMKHGSGENSNESIIDTYKRLKNLGIISQDEPNYELARKVFLDFNDFNLINTENDLTIYLDYIPQSLLPYPKNYIKYAYYIFLEKLKKDNNIEMYSMVESVGVFLFTGYPNYKKYKENLKDKKIIDESFQDLNLKENFKRIYGVYEISEEDYNSSASSIDVPSEKLLNDFGILLNIEEDIQM